MRPFLLLTIIALLGCSEQKPGKDDLTDSSSAYEEYPISLPPAIMDAEVEGFIPGEMDVLFGELKTDTFVLFSIDETSLTDDIKNAIEANDRRALTRFENAGWTLSAPAGTRLVALHADDYPYVRIQLEDVTFGKRRGFVHKKCLELDDKGIDLSHFTSDRGRGEDWRSR